MPNEKISNVYQFSSGTLLDKLVQTIQILYKFAQNIGLFPLEKKDTVNPLWDTSCFCAVFTGKKWKETLLCPFSR